MPVRTNLLPLPVRTAFALQEKKDRREYVRAP